MERPPSDPLFLFSSMFPSRIPLSLLHLFRGSPSAHPCLLRPFLSPPPLKGPLPPLHLSAQAGPGAVQAPISDPLPCATSSHPQTRGADSRISTKETTRSREGRILVCENTDREPGF